MSPLAPRAMKDCVATDSPVPLTASCALHAGTAETPCTYTRLRDGLFSNISHELLTPITSLHGYLSLLAQEVLGPLAAEQAEAVRIALRNAEMLHGMIGDLLDFAALSRDALALARVPTAVAALLDTALPRVQALAADRDVTLAVRVPADAGTVLGDPPRLARVLEHLLENAVKFSPSGSRVQVRVTRRRHRVNLTIRDRASGMDPDDVRRLLLPFIQGETGLIRRYNGLGLGLPFAEQLLALHGGTLRIATRPGHGTVVTVSLPLYRG